MPLVNEGKDFLSLISVSCLLGRVTCLTLRFVVYLALDRVLSRKLPQPSELQLESPFGELWWSSLDRNEQRLVSFSSS